MGAKVNRGRKVSDAEFRRMIESGEPLASIGAKLGISAQAVWFRKETRGIPAPMLGRTKAKLDAAPRILALYRAGISIDEITRVCRVSKLTVRQTAKAAGEPLRGKRGTNCPRLHDLAQERLAKAMAETARMEQAQIKLAEMWDQPGHNTSGKRKTNLAA